MGIAIYARKSSESEDRQVQSLDDQINALKSFAAREGIMVTEVIQESRSAKSPYSRPEFEELIRKINSGEIQGVLTWAINRLSRNLIDGGIVAHLLQTGRLQFIKTPERTYKPEDNVLIMSIENGMATSFVQDLSRNVKRGLIGKCERGWYPGAAPIGYKNNFETHEIEPDPKRFPLVQQAWKLLLSNGVNIMEIHREMVRLGLTGIQKATRSKPVGRTTVYRIFANRFYAGEFDFNGKRYSGKHKAMITSAEFSRAQAILSGNPVTRPQKHEFAYAGTMTCGICGCAIVAERKIKLYKTTGRRAEYVYYRCTGAKGCTKVSATEDALFAAVETYYGKFEVDDSFLDWCEESLKRSAAYDNNANATSSDHTRKELSKLESRQKSLTNLRLDGEVGQEEFQNLRTEIESQIKELQSQLELSKLDSDAINDLIMTKINAVAQLSHAREMSINCLKGQLRALGSKHVLTLGKPNFSVDPLIQNMLTFEPRVSSSERSNSEHCFASNSNWLGIVSEVRKSARERIMQERNGCSILKHRLL